MHEVMFRYENIHKENSKAQARIGRESSVHETGFRSELPALPNITHIKNTSLGEIMLFECLLELLGGLKHILLGKYPSAPVHAQCLLALGIFEDMNSVVGIGMCCTENMTRGVCSNGDQPKIKWSTELTYLLESRTYGEIVLGVPIILPLWHFVHCPIAGVTGVGVSKEYFDAADGLRSLSYPAKYTLLPPDSMAQEAHSVLYLSKGVRAVTC